MAEYEDKTSAQQGGSEEPRNFAGVQEAVHVCVQENNGKAISVVARLVHRRKLPSKGKRFTFADAVNWMRQGGPAWRGFLISAVSVAGFAALMGVVAFALLFISSNVNAAWCRCLQWGLSWHFSSHLSLFGTWERLDLEASQLAP